MNNLNVKFLKRLQGENGVTEITDRTKNLWWIENYNKLIKQKTNLYFISFVPNEQRKKEKEETWKLPRTSKEYIWGINYFKADFDIRSYIYDNAERFRIITDEEILEYKDRILNELRKDELLGTYNAVIFSWNGIHIYWIGKTITPDAETYAAQSRRLYDRIKELFPNEPHLWPDYACSNIWRLLRLPGSFNYKTKYWLPPKEVRILEYKEEDSPLIDFLDEYGWTFPIGEESDVSLLKDDMQYKCKLSAELYDGNDLYQRINSLDIARLVYDYTGWKLNADWKNFISNRDGQNTGAYIIPEENVVVHTGTPHISDFYKVYSPFAFIMVHYAGLDIRTTFEVAKELYPEVKQKWRLYFANEEEDESWNRTHKYLR